MSARAPTDAEYTAFTGLHCSGLWQSLSDQWRCPVCNRTKRGIMRWGKRVGSNAARFGAVGWTCGLHSHHDHQADEDPTAAPRFQRTVICGACNWLDARIKKACGTPADFSFAPDDLRRCIDLTKVLENESIPATAINFALAMAIYQKVIE